MPVYRLNDREISFPNPAFAERSGLLAVGGDLHPDRILTAYQYGVFPWFEEGGLYYWYSPDPRCVLFPEELIIHKSMRSVFNGNKFHYTLDTRFREVMTACASVPRYGENGSWITEAFIESYTELHEAGVAHSVEVWQGENLVGGLYGLSLGKIFYGESMFSNVPNASKAGFITLTRALQQAEFWLIDCQQETPHLKTLGARTIPRSRFLDYLGKNRFHKTLIGSWEMDASKGIRLK